MAAQPTLLPTLSTALSTAPTPLPAKPSQRADLADRAGQNFLRLKKQYGIFQAKELGPVIRNLPSSTTHLVEGLIPPRSVNILVGDSGIGKSPLAYQLGLAVASGAPFLDMPVRRGKVLLVDFENSLADVQWIMEQQRKHLGLAECPCTFQVWPMNLDPLQDKVEEVIAIFAPDLVILDSLRSFSPAMESDNRAAVEQIKSLRVTAAEHGTAFLLIHHIRKRSPLGRFGVPASPSGLEEGDVMDWLLRTSGVRALINQTDVRLALARSSRSAGAEEDTLILRGHFRTRGEVGPFLLRRKRADGNGESKALALDGAGESKALALDGAGESKALALDGAGESKALALDGAGESKALALDGAGESKALALDGAGEPLGYERMIAHAAMLENAEQETFFARLPEAFSYKDARLLYGKSNDSTHLLIHKMMRLGLVRRAAYGQYRKAGGVAGGAVCQ